MQICFKSQLGRLAISLFIFFLSLPPAFAQTFSTKEIAMLIEAVEKNTPWSQKELQTIFQSKSLRKLEETVRLNVTEPLQLTEQRYKHFTEPYAINLAKKFTRKWRTTLRQAAHKYSVDPEVIVAIMLVETSFGRFQGDFHLLSVFASTYVEASHMLVSPAYQKLDEAMQQRVARRAEWARKELEALLIIAKQHPGIQALSLKGSYAGAFGKAQFLPSSYLRFAVRAREQGSPDLFFEPDAIFSIANYLKGHGYQPGLRNDENRKAVYAYNHSNVYVTVVLRVAEALQGVLDRPG